MKRLPVLATLTGLLALLGGCQTAVSTTASRAEEKSRMFQALPAAQQQKLRDGIVEVGDTAGMVYVALGQPTEVAVTGDGRVGVWTYRKFYPSAAASPRPLYGARAHYRGRNPLATGPSAAGAHDGGAIGPVAHGPREGGPLGTGWATPDYSPVTLQVAFKAGRVFRLAVREEGS